MSFNDACATCGHTQDFHDHHGCIEDRCPGFRERVPHDTSKINTEEIRSSVGSFIRVSAEHGVNPGNLVRWTIPGLCDEVDRLRALVEQQKALIGVYAIDPEGHYAGTPAHNALLALDRVRNICLTATHWCAELPGPVMVPAAEILKAAEVDLTGGVKKEND